MAVLYLEMSHFMGDFDVEPQVELWEGPDEELLLEQVRYACRGIDARVRILDRDGNEVAR